MMWLAAQLWPFALVSLLAGFAITWWAVVRSVPVSERPRDDEEYRRDRGGASDDVASQPRAVGHSLDARHDAPVEHVAHPVEDDEPVAEPPRRRAVAVGEAFKPRVDEDEGMSDDFENDPYDESPVHQLADDGAVDDDPDDDEPGDAPRDDASEWDERERRTRH